MVYLLRGKVIRVTGLQLGNVYDYLYLIQVSAQVKSKF